MRPDSFALPDLRGWERGRGRALVAEEGWEGDATVEGGGDGGRKPPAAAGGGCDCARVAIGPHWMTLGALYFITTLDLLLLGYSVQHEAME